MNPKDTISKKISSTKASFEVVPPEFRHPGLGGGVSFSPDGFSLLLIRALAEAKEAASKCSEDPEMQDEYQIFNRRAAELEEELKNYLSSTAESD